MGKYDPLYAFLSDQSDQSVQLSFHAIESIIGDKLPKSAYTYREWWANGSHCQASAWMDANYKVETVDFSRKIISFLKIN